MCVCVTPGSVLVRERKRERERERERDGEKLGRSPPSFVVQGKGEKGARERERGGGLGEERKGKAVSVRRRRA